MSSETVAVDPSRHLLSTHQHAWDDAGEPVRSPVSFAEHVASSRESLDPRFGAESSHGVELAGTEALVAATLLRELSARLRYDARRGAISPDAEQLAVLTDDLVERFYSAAGLRG
ncbi:hypothetical protein E1218_23920 [Kribbella turkmenica]|uniref:Uncharacterized protein n=1 Tax=Kribbella turkmenica TaxID=2530375 RepID=A0A4R4WR05_9ACTN|nr:hypothetical protein [Kribbella turkmenica]TDD19515.1 hypothetical protein E1218_23920 [Kribbella turkmenica]